MESYNGAADVLHCLQMLRGPIRFAGYKCAWLTCRYAFDADVNDARTITVPRLDGFKIDIEGVRYGAYALRLTMS